MTDTPEITNSIYFFLGLTNLQVLELTGNILYEGSIAPWAFKPLKSLKYLRLDKNRFSSIPAGLPPSLEVSSVIQPMFQSLASLYKFRVFVFWYVLVYLQDLRLQENQIVEVQDRLLDKCVHLKVLDLSHNLLKENSIYPEAWVKLPWVSHAHFYTLLIHIIIGLYLLLEEWQPASAFLVHYKFII